MRVAGAILGRVLRELLLRVDEAFLGALSDDDDGVALLLDAIVDLLHEAVRAIELVWVLRYKAEVDFTGRDGSEKWNEA